MLYCKRAKSKCYISYDFPITLNSKRICDAVLSIFFVSLPLLRE